MTDELQALEAQAAALDAQTAAASADPAAAPEPEAVKVDTAAEVAALLGAVSGMLAPVFPCLPSIYTESTCKRLGDAAAPVMDKYGLSVGGLFERWGAEITLLATALPVALATYRGCRADLAARRAPPDPTENQPAYAEQRAA